MAKKPKPEPKAAAKDRSNQPHPLNPFRINESSVVVGQFVSYAFQPGAKFIDLHYAAEGSEIIDFDDDTSTADRRHVVRINPGYSAELIARSHTIGAHGITVVAEIVRTPEHRADVPLLDELLTLAAEQAKAPAETG